MNSRNQVHVQFAVKKDPPPASQSRTKKSLRLPTAADDGAAGGEGTKGGSGKHVQFSGGGGGKSGGDDGAQRVTGSTLGSTLLTAGAAAVPQRTKTRVTKEGVPVFGCPVSAARMGRRPASASNVRLVNAEPPDPPAPWCIPTGSLVNRDYALIDMDLAISSRRRQEWSKSERPHTVRRVDERPEYLHAFRPKVERTEYWRPFTTNGPVYKPPPPAPNGNVQPWSKACRDDDIDARAVPHSQSNMSRETFLRAQMPRAPAQRDRVQVSAKGREVVDELGSGSRPTSKVLPSHR